MTRQYGSWILFFFIWESLWSDRMKLEFTFVYLGIFRSDRTVVECSCFYPGVFMVRSFGSWIYFCLFGDLHGPIVCQLIFFNIYLRYPWSGRIVDVLIWSIYLSACGSYHDFLDIWLLLKLLNQWCIVVKLESSLRTFYGRQHHLVNRSRLFASRMTRTMFRLS